MRKSHVQVPEKEMLVSWPSLVMLGGDEHVLRKALVLEVFVEAGEVFDLAEACCVFCDGVEED